jgi:hypothetical protein
MLVALNYKLRKRLQGRGKSGGISVIYDWIKDEHLIYRLVAYFQLKI